MLQGKKRKHHTIIMWVNFFTYNKSILKCSYVLKGITYGKKWYQNKYCDVHFHGFLCVEITKVYQNSKKWLVSVAINLFKRYCCIYMTHNENIEQTTHPKSFYLFSESSSCKVIGFHKWSLKFSKIIYGQDIRYLVQINLCKHTWKIPVYVSKMINKLSNMARG